MNLHRTLSTLALALSVAALAVGCAAKPEKKLVGRWGADKAAMMKSEKFMAVPPEAREMALKGIEMMAAATVEFKDDGKFSVEMPGMKEEGDWSVTAVDGDNLTISSKRSKDGKEKVLKATIVGSGITLTIMGDEAVPFVRK